MAQTKKEITGTEKATPIDDPRALTIYQVMVGSFIHSDNGAEGYRQMWGPDGNTKDGNLRGVIEALPHIASLGVNAIWLTPIFDSRGASGGEKLQASGYFCKDYFAIDPHFGTEDDLRELVDKAHEMGLYIILDGVFGHHGGVDKPSPGGKEIDSTKAINERDEEGNVKYPESLDYFKEVATYWIDRFDIDGWRLDQAYQLCQDGHNYWVEISQAVKELTERRRKEGKQWGILGYMVGEDWSDAKGISERILRDGGLTSAFDFDGKELISGPMADLASGGLENGWDDVVKVYSAPSERGYSPDDVMPNLFLSNHDGFRVADHFYDDDNDINVMTRFAILAGYPGPVTLYYGDEFADLSRDSKGAQPDNAARTSGHLMAADERGAKVYNYVSRVMHFRKDNPAMWRGEQEFNRYRNGEAEVLIVTKTDPESDNKVVMAFADRDTTEIISGIDYPVEIKAFVPELIRIS
ncbi:MAG: alpha-amylase family glycosyl hydrolase [Pseudoflavonifractor sp.]|nr:alpha-amylase family glycosyl hydrolase [Alloprevotella sp.]MCM1116928.1 alpha-amylase family glycosyl hydrolase [Pseudoflavonifractor sp.]